MSPYLLSDTFHQGICWKISMNECSVSLSLCSHLKPQFRGRLFYTTKSFWLYWMIFAFVGFNVKISLWECILHNRKFIIQVLPISWTALSDAHMSNICAMPWFLNEDQDKVHCKRHSPVLLKESVKRAKSIKSHGMFNRLKCSCGHRVEPSSYQQRVTWLAAQAAYGLRTW